MGLCIDLKRSAFNFVSQPVLARPRFYALLFLTRRSALQVRCSWLLSVLCNSLVRAGVQDYCPSVAHNPMNGSILSLQRSPGMAKNFAIIGVAGFVAPRHLKAIKSTGNRLAAAVDSHDSAGVLDQFSRDVRFFTEIERFDRHLEKLRRRSDVDRIHYISICSPNYLHDAHIRLALRVGAEAICEKPLVINPWNLDALQELEAETGCSISTVLQLRLHPDLLALKERLATDLKMRHYDVQLTYVTVRGPWYQVSWKGSEAHSGGLATNIGIHLFDLMLWLFGTVQESEVYLKTPTKMAGLIELERGTVRWFLSTDVEDLPRSSSLSGLSSFRSLTIDSQEMEFSDGFMDLHTRVYQEILAGRGCGINDARPSIELMHRIRHSRVTQSPMLRYPTVAGLRV
jgi:UDP-N-acetyl-2-amino-2-deoxyglucuronate dehydrogenase